MALSSRIRSILEKLGAGSDITDNQDVFATGVVSSLSLLELICCLEDKFGISVTQRDVFEGHLKSVERITALIAARVKVA